MICTTNIGSAVDHNDDGIFNIAHHYFNECMNVLNLENMPLIRHSCVLRIISAIRAISDSSASIICLGGRTEC